MNNEPLYLFAEEETVRLNGPVPIACTKSMIRRLKEMGFDSDELLKRFASQQVYLLNMTKTKDRDGNPVYNMLSDRAVLSCIMSEQGYLLAIDAQKKTVRRQYEFIRNAVKLLASEGAVIWFDDKGAGRRVWGSGSHSPTHAMDAFTTMKERLLEKLNEGMTISSTNNDEVSEDKRQGLRGEAEQLLETAEFYVIAEDEIDKAEAQSGQYLSYFQVSADSDFRRVEKIAYRFSISELDERVYKKGSRIVLDLLNGEKTTGVITKLFKIAIVWELVVLFDRLFDVNLLQPIGTLIPEYNSVQRIVRESVIQELRNGSAKAAYFDDIVSGHPIRPAHTGKAEAVLQGLRNAERTPNESQLEVIRRGIEVEDALLVLGPPGTGKTTVILEWVKYFVKQEGKRVLISSQNNKAVDNVLERFAKEADIDTIRIGSEEKVQSNVKHLMFENRAIDLQHQIVKSMGKCSKQLYESEGHIQRYAAHAKAAAEVTRMLNSAAMELDKQYHQVREVRLPLLRSLYNDVLATRSRLEDIETGIHTITIKLRRMERSAWAVKFLQLPIRLLEKNKLQKKLEAHRMFVTREKELVLLYNEAYQSLCTAALAEVKAHTRQAYWDMRVQWKGAIEPLLHPPLLELKALNIHAPHFSNDSEQALQEVKELVWQSEARTKSIHLIQSAMDRWSEYVDQKRNYALAQVLLESVDLVGATCIGINSQQRFKDLDFDVTIIDEAGQIQIHNAIVPMSRSSKVIMLGDHMQIPPIADGQVIERCEQAGMDESLLSKSFFEYLYERFPDNNKMLLDTQYRMPAQIADLLSEWFYEGKYMSYKDKRSMPSALPGLFLDPFAIVSTSAAPKRKEIRMEGEGGGYYNDYEAQIVAAIVRDTLRTIKPGTSRYYHLSEIGVIAPYNAQVKHLRSTLSGFLSETSEDEMVQLVATLDSFQGQERPIIIYSCTRSNSKPPHLERVGFLKELRRLNVALSRSQMQLVFIGDLEFLRSCEYEQLDTFGLPMTDEWGKPMQGTSEKQFSMFINLMMDKAIKGNGQLLNAVDQFKEVQHV